MKEDNDFLEELFQQISKKIDKPYRQLLPFLQEMKKNWYDTPSAVRQLTNEQFQQMGFPLRIVTAIRDQINQLSAIKSHHLNSQSKFIEGDAHKNMQSSKSEIGATKLTQKSMLQSVRKLEDDMMIKYPWIGEQLLRVFEIVQKIIKNIISDPFELKFRVLKKTNPRIQEIVMDNMAVLVFLKEIGFEQNEETITLDRFQIHELYFMDECLQAVVENHREQNRLQNESMEKVGSQRQ